LDQLHAMRVFLAVADRASFAGAARGMRLSPAAVTRTIGALEAKLGLQLLRRTTRSVQLTERGAIYAERCRSILRDIEDATSIVRGENAAPRGLLTLTAPSLFGRLHILPAVEQMMSQHAELRVRLLLFDRVAHLVEEGFDAAIRIGTLADSALVGVPLTSVRRVLVASPDYLAAAGTPADLGDLRKHRIVGFEGVGSTNNWHFGVSRKRSVTVVPYLSVNDADAAIASAERGRGVARAFSYQVEKAVADGRLVPLLVEHEPAPLPVSIVYQVALRGNPNIAALIAQLRRSIRNEGDSNGSRMPTSPVG
jgi:DNA-binding transcriptional LysR family regulator